MNRLSSDPSTSILLRPLQSQDTSEESHQLVPREIKHEDTPNDQNQNPISKSRSNIQRNENSILLPPDIEKLISEDPLTEQLQAILESQAKFGIRKGFVLCLTLSLWLWSVGFGWINSTSVLRSAFPFCYAYLGYLLIETIIQFRTENILRWKKMEKVYLMVDIIVLLLTILARDLLDDSPEFPVETILAPLLFNFTAYIFTSQAPANTKISNIMLRFFFMMEITLAILQIRGILDEVWSGIGIDFIALFSLVWMMYCVLTGLIFIFLTCRIYYFRLKQTHERANESMSLAPAFLWLCWYSSNGVHLFTVLLNNMDQEQELTSHFIVFGMINFLFCMFTLAKYRELIKSFVAQTTDEKIYRKELENIDLPEISIKKQKVNLELIQLSSTYFTSTQANTKQEAFVNIDNDSNNEHLCYICYNKAPDAVMARCGHGGICMDCVIPTIEVQGICMECRQTVEAVLKIDLDSVREGRVKAVEAIVVK